MSKLIFKIIIGLFIISLSSFVSGRISSKTDGDIVFVFNKVFNEPFFNDYRINKILHVQLQSELLLKELNHIKKIHPTLKESINQVKFVLIDEFYQGDNFMRIQIGCYKTERNFFIEYSTSFQRNELNGQMELIDSVSPFIDTVWISKK